MSQASLPLGTVAGSQGDIRATRDAGPSDRISQPNLRPRGPEQHGFEEDMEEEGPQSGEYGEIFVGTDPSKPFEYVKTYKPVLFDNTHHGLYCLVCNSLQSLPSQCRGFAFMHLEEDDWRLSFIVKLDKQNDQLTYVDMNFDFSLRTTSKTVDATNFFVSQRLHFVNIHTTIMKYREKFDSLATFGVFDSGKTFMDGRFDGQLCLEAGLSPTSVLLKNDAKHYTPRPQNRKRKRSKTPKMVKATSAGRKTVTIYVNTSRCKTGMDGVSLKEKSKQSVVVPSPLVSANPDNPSRPWKVIIPGKLHLNKRRHYIYPSSKLHKLHNKSALEVLNLLEEEAANNEHCQHFSLFEITNKVPIRFSLIDQESFQILRDKKPEQSFTLGENEYLWRFDERASQLIEGTTPTTSFKVQTIALTILALLTNY